MAAYESGSRRGGQLPVNSAVRYTPKTVHCLFERAGFDQFQNISYSIRNRDATGNLDERKFDPAAKSESLRREMNTMCREFLRSPSKFGFFPRQSFRNNLFFSRYLRKIYKMARCKPNDAKAYQRGESFGAYFLIGSATIDERM